MKTLICDGCNQTFVLKHKSNQESLKSKGIRVFCSRKCRDRTIAPAINERAKKAYYTRKERKKQQSGKRKTEWTIFHQIMAGITA